MRALINALGPEDHLYVCGPGAMMDEAQDLGGSLGDRLHLERFGAVSAGGQTSYEVELARRGDIVPVGVGETMLDALRNAEVEVPSSCEAGVCLDCKVRYLSGTPEHRDLALSKSDRNSYLTPCVSGCAGGRIVLDL
jgi:ferredoxin